jgi:membrane associated rhomboid family serine protease
MFPLRDENPTLHTSLATFAIIAANIATWFFVQGFGFNPTLAASVAEFGLIPGELFGVLPPGHPIVIGYGHYAIAAPHWISIFTHMFMHGGWFHLIGNMWFLAVLGDNVEDVMGSVKFVIFYLLCGLAAATAQIIAGPTSAIPMVGASGAIGGVMGAYALLFPRAPVHMLVFFGFFFTRIVVPAFLVLGYWFVIQFASGFLSAGSAAGQVAVWAHVGGFTAGIVLVKAFCNKKRLMESRQSQKKMERMFSRYGR